MPVGLLPGIAMPAMPLPIRALLRVRESPQNTFFRKLELLFKDPLEATEGFQKTRRYCMRLCNSSKSSRQWDAHPLHQLAKVSLSSYHWFSSYIFSCRGKGQAQHVAWRCMTGGIELSIART